MTEEQTTLELKVCMHCKDCSRKVAKVLRDMQDLEFWVDLSEQKVTAVKGSNLDPEKVMKKLAKQTRRHVDPWPPTAHANTDSDHDSQESSNNQNIRGSESFQYVEHSVHANPDCCIM